MRRLLPETRDEQLEDLYLDLTFPEPPAGRPYLYLDMVASVDGAATAGGRTAQLSGEADELAFSRLREWCDVILVGASTVRIEDYGPPRPSTDARARRAARGLPEVPRIVVVTASCSLNPAGRLFSDPTRRPLVVAPEEGHAERLAGLAAVADVLQVGTGRVDLARALSQLHRDGVSRVLCEGGPSLNAGLLRAGLVDELFLTVSPVVVAGAALRIVDGEVPHVPLRSKLEELREHAGELLLRYRFAA
ncbi:MAG: dihydrofolate reductase family protein [Actinomycetota bacterium]|nr:dihydrofolate reductase family protein [Actinomycetota bacterium]